MMTSSSSYTRQLVLSIVEAFMILENSSDGEIDPHVAVRGMENISSILLAMNDSDQSQLGSEIIKLANEQADESYRNFMLKLPSNIGLTSH